MIRFLIFVALFLAPQAAMALSCMRPDVVRDYQRAEGSRDVYAVVVGQLSFDPADVPTHAFDDPLPPEPVTDIRARLRGRSLSDNGFDRAFDQAVTLRVNCFAVWCAAPQPGEVLAFLKRESGGYVVSVDPCGTMTHPEPRDEQIDAVETCFRGGPCEPAPDL